MNFTKSLLRFTTLCVAFYLIIISGYYIWNVNYRAYHEPQYAAADQVRLPPYEPASQSIARDVTLSVGSLGAIGLTILWMDWRKTVD